MAGITVYGTAKILAQVRVRERFFKIRRDGIGQHYWHKVWRIQLIGEDRRFEFHSGTGKYARAIGINLIAFSGYSKYLIPKSLRH